MEEEGKRVAEPSSATRATYLSEVRLETSPAAIGFSDTCPCCGNRKRRCLHPASSFRKKLLVLDTSTASLSLTPPFPYICSDPISPMPPPLTPPIHPPPAAAASPPSDQPAKTLERSNSTLTAASVKDGERAAAEEAEEEEVRVSVRCRCGVVRRILLVR